MFNYSYSVNVFLKDDLISKVSVNGTEVTFQNVEGVDPVFLPFGVKTCATIDDLSNFYESRCFPRERENCKEILKELGVDCYIPELICRKTHGVQFDDFVWLQFSDEPQVCWNDIKWRD